MSLKTPIGIRLNPDVTGTTNEKISTGSKKEKFGLLFRDWINLSKKIASFIITCIRNHPLGIIPSKSIRLSRYLGAKYQRDKIIRNYDRV